MSKDPKHEAAAKEHEALIGCVALTWNAFQHMLSQLFAKLVTPSNHDIGYAAWHAIRSDRQQREMLLAAVKIALKDQKFERLRTELVWALDQVNSIESVRNNTVHAPYGVTVEGGALRITATDSTGNRMAMSLANKDIKLVCEACISHLTALRDFIQGLGHHYLGGLGSPDGLPWPERPKLRQPAQATQKKSNPPTQTRAKHPPPPEPSQE